MRIGIVGSRKRKSLKDHGIVVDIIYKAIAKFGADNVTIVSGECEEGADRFAKIVAELYGLKYQPWPIDKSTPIKDKREFTRRAYARNRQIAEDSDVVFALVHPSRKGGTENTLRHCKDLGTKSFWIDLDGTAYLHSDGKKPADTPGDPPAPSPQERKKG